MNGTADGKYVARSVNTTMVNIHTAPKIAPYGMRRFGLKISANSPVTSSPSGADREALPTAIIGSSSSQRTHLADARVDDGVQHVDRQVHDDDHHDDDGHDRLDDEQVLGQDRGDQQRAHALHGEELLHHDGTA